MRKFKVGDRVKIDFDLLKGRGLRRSALELEIKFGKKFNFTIKRDQSLYLHIKEHPLPLRRDEIIESYAPEQLGLFDEIT